MQNRPNWSEWILQKNSEAKQEELRKSEFVQLEKAVWEHAPHIAPQGCKCSGASRGDDMHHYSCVDANPKPAVTASQNIDIKHDMSPKLKDAIDKFNKNVNVGHIKWDHDGGHAYSYVDHDHADSRNHGLDERDSNRFEDAVNWWLYENDHHNAIDCVKGGSCGCNP